MECWQNLNKGGKGLCRKCDNNHSENKSLQCLLMGAKNTDKHHSCCHQARAMVKGRGGALNGHNGLALKRRKGNSLMSAIDK